MPPRSSLGGIAGVGSEAGFGGIAGLGGGVGGTAGFGGVAGTGSVADSGSVDECSDSIECTEDQECVNHHCALSEVDCASRVSNLNDSGDVCEDWGGWIERSSQGLCEDVRPICPREVEAVLACLEITDWQCIYEGAEHAHGRAAEGGA